MKKRGKDKQASVILISAVVFIVVVLLFSAILLYFVSRAGKMAPIFEQLYSKEIALMIDKAIPGTNMTLDITKPYEVSKENKYLGEMIRINNSDHSVFVKLAYGKGFNHKFFSDSIILWNINERTKTLSINIIKNPKEKIIIESTRSSNEITDPCDVNLNNCEVLNATCKCPRAGDLNDIKRGINVKLEDCTIGMYCYYGLSGCQENKNFPEDVKNCKEALGTRFIQAPNRCEVDKSNCKVLNPLCTCPAFGELYDKSQGKDIALETCVAGQFCNYNVSGCETNANFPEIVKDCKESLGKEFIQAPNCTVDSNNIVTNAPCTCPAEGQLYEKNQGKDIALDTCVIGQYCYFGKYGCQLKIINN